MAHSPHRLAIFIGRFQSFTPAHFDVLRRAALASDEVLMLVGSSYRPRSMKNPFSFDERKGFILDALRGGDIEGKVKILPLIDTLYNDLAWQNNVRTAVNSHIRKNVPQDVAASVTLVGCDKDASSDYLRWFPEWRCEMSEPMELDGRLVSATDMREAMFFGPPGGFTEARFGAPHVQILQDWMAKAPDAVAQIREEGAFIRGYRAKTAAAEAVFGYPIPINTADAVVVQSGHVLLVERAAAPGKGLWALPGGHIDANETAQTAVIRELVEETRLKVAKGRLHSRIAARRVFDHPQRSERGWVRTEAFRIDLEGRGELELVKGGSDARRARWFSLSEVAPDFMFEDHFDIIQAMVPETPFAYAPILLAHN